jgi:transcription antitermination factor NusG
MQSKPQKESILSDQLGLRNIDVYYPCLQVHPVNPRARKSKPYFPRYLFVHLDPGCHDLSWLRWVTGAIGLVSFGGEPASVPENVVHAIRERVDQINAAGGDRSEGLEQDELVVIQDGPFAGYQALFNARLSGSKRVRVLIDLLRKGRISVNLPAGQIRSLKQH